MSTESSPILVIGGGAAGLIAAWKAATTGGPVRLLERNAKAGLKILISGGGKCNITHDGSVEEIMRGFPLREARFLKHAFYSFSNDDIRSLLRSRGVATVVRDDGRVFPASNRAAEVVRALTDQARAAGAEILLNARVTDVLVEGGRIIGVMVGEKQVAARQVILATGGASYRKTGTTGDGYAWAQAAGHTIVPLRPALAPLHLHRPLPSEWRGIAVRGGRLDVFAGGKRIMTWSGDILCTHEGLSGPAALEVSRATAVALTNGPVTLRFDFFPEQDRTTLDALFNGMVLTNRQRQISTLLESWLPNRMIPRLLLQAGVPPDTRGAVLTRERRHAIITLLKSWEIGEVDHVELDRGEVTAGGILLDEVDPHSMRSRVVQGLYAAGEVLDVAGRVGGYNLQAAFSTGFLAGAAAAADRAEFISLS